jgi:hypothetical protein
MTKNIKRIEIELLGTPPVKQPGPNESDKNRQRRVKLRQAALNIARESDWPVELYDKRLKLTIYFNRATSKMDSANIIGGIADALQGPCYHNDFQLNEVHYSEHFRSRKKFKRDKYQVILEPLEQTSRKSR